MDKDWQRGSKFMNDDVKIEKNLVVVMMVIKQAVKLSK